MCPLIWLGNPFTDSTSLISSWIQVNGRVERSRKDLWWGGWAFSLITPLTLASEETGGASKSMCNKLQNQHNPSSKRIITPKNFLQLLYLPMLQRLLYLRSVYLCITELTGETIKAKKDSKLLWSNPKCFFLVAWTFLRNNSSFAFSLRATAHNSFTPHSGHGTVIEGKTKPPWDGWERDRARKWGEGKTSPVHWSSTVFLLMVLLTCSTWLPSRCYKAKCLLDMPQKPKAFLIRGLTPMLRSSSLQAWAQPVQETYFGCEYW